MSQIKNLKLYYNPIDNYYLCINKNEFDINKLNKIFLEVKISEIFKHKLRIDTNGYSIPSDINMGDASDDQVPFNISEPREKNTLIIKIQSGIISLMKIFTGNDDITSEVAGFLLPEKTENGIILKLHKKLIKGTDRGPVGIYSIDYNFIFHTHPKKGYHIPSIGDVFATFVLCINSIIKRFQPQMHFVFCFNSVYTISLSSEMTYFISNFLYEHLESESAQLQLEFFFKKRFFYVLDHRFFYWEEIKRIYTLSDIDFANDPNENFVGIKVCDFLNKLSVGHLYKLFKIKSKYQEYEYYVMAKIISFFSKKLPDYLASSLSFDNLFAYFKTNQDEEFENIIIENMQNILLFSTKFHSFPRETTDLDITCENIPYDYTKMSMVTSNENVVDFNKPIDFNKDLDFTKRVDVEYLLLERMKEIPYQNITLNPEFSLRQTIEEIKNSPIDSYLVIQK